LHASERRLNETEWRLHASESALKDWERSLHSRDLRLHASEPELKGDERNPNAIGSRLNEREPELNGVEFGWVGGDVGVSLFEGYSGVGPKLSDRRDMGKKNL
jgi:hypothetical protein